MSKDTPMGKRLQKKADEAKDERIRSALLKADIKGLSREQAQIKLKIVVENELERGIW
jgi:hypothetical protein